jgi:RNA polymerase sigma-70 factor (ECF subfamily)
MDNLQRAIDKLYKERFGQLVALLLYSSRDIDPKTAEDIVHDSFSAALTDWRKNGIPANQAGWIYKVCKNKALNTLRLRHRMQGISDSTPVQMIETRFPDSSLNDHQLTLLFACAHPDLAPKIQVVLTLKYVANLKVEAIAKCLAMTVDGIDKLLVRARQKIKDEKILLAEPPVEDLKPRLATVHKIIYLMFNEGYKSSWGNELVREDLCEEALLVNRSLLACSLANKETAALQALMLFNSARFASRFDASGELVELENQDRNLWSKELIALGNHYLTESQCDTLSNYHLEAYIAYLHCSAPCFEATDWKLITQLYAILLKHNPNPFVRLSYAIASYYGGRKQESFKTLNELKQISFFNHYYLFNLTLGKLHFLEGHHDVARNFLTKAMAQTNFTKERNFIANMLSKLNT